MGKIPGKIETCEHSLINFWQVFTSVKICENEKFIFHKFFCFAKFLVSFGLLLPWYAHYIILGESKKSIHV